jgi:hypothetical protein
MSYEILNNIYYNKNIYNINNDNNNTYIFELELKGLNNKNIIIRKIKKSNKGNIISQNDNIKPNMIKKFKLTIINLNNIDNPIIIKNNFNILKSQDLILPEGNNDIYLKFYETKDKLIEVKYIIN